MFSPFDAKAYSQAVAHERLVRDAAFLVNPSTGQPLTEFIGDFEVYPMTLNHYTSLRIADNPLLYRFRASLEQIAQFIWIVSVDYEPSKEAQVRWTEEKCTFLKDPKPTLIRTRQAVEKWAGKFRDMIALRENLEIACLDYVRESLQDKPPLNRKYESGKSYFSEACRWSATMAREYPGCNLSDVPRMPLKQLFQFLNEIKSRKPGIPLCNPSDDLVAQWQMDNQRQ